MKSYFYEIYRSIISYKLEYLIGLIAISLVIPPLPSSTPLFYAILFGIFLYSATRKNISINFLLVCFYVAAYTSIVFGTPNPAFRSYERLGLFVMLTGAVFPLFSSKRANLFRFKLLSSTIKICILVSTISFACFFLGINYMSINQHNFTIAGIFGGITNQSMMLAPICMISAVYLCNVLLYSTHKKWIIVTLLVVSILTLFMAASRSAFVATLVGVLISLAVKYWDNKSKGYKIIIGIICVSVIAFPLYEQYASIIMDKQIKNEAAGGIFSSREKKWNARLTEFSNSPMNGIGFASVDWTLEPETINSSGVVEPGSSWLAVLSMTGILGAIPIFLILVTTLRRLLAHARSYNDCNSCILLGLIVAFIFHQVAEGYALSGGSYLCFLFWLTLGVGHSYTHIFYESDNPINMSLL